MKTPEWAQVSLQGARWLGVEARKILFTTVKHTAMGAAPVFFLGSALLAVGNFIHNHCWARTDGIKAAHNENMTAIAGMTIEVAADSAENRNLAFKKIGSKFALEGVVPAGIDANQIYDRIIAAKNEGAASVILTDAEAAVFNQAVQNPLQILGVENNAKFQPVYASYDPACWFFFAGGISAITFCLCREREKAVGARLAANRQAQLAH